MIRYKHLGYVALNVTDLARSEAFYRDVYGLMPSGVPTDTYRFFRCSERHHDVVLCQAERPGLKRVGFELESADSLAELQRALDKAGVAFIPIPAEDEKAMATEGGIRCVEPYTGCTLDFYLGMQAADGPFVPTVAKIQRLGHVVLRSDRYAEAVQFFHDVLNFKISDMIGENVTFMRCFPNPFHHSLGIGDAKGKSKFNHINVMVSDVDDIGKSLWRLKRANVPVVNGPGRHVASGSIFLYFLDPDGLTVEYSFGMEEFPPENPREPRKLEPVRANYDMWEGPVDPRKATVGDIESFPIDAR